MIPIRDNLPHPAKPIVVSVLVGIMVAVFALELGLEATGALDAVLQDWGKVPIKVNQAIAAIFAEWNPAAIVVLIGMAVPSLIASLFLHGSFAQIVGNLIFLWVFGQSLEGILGRGRLLFLFLIGGIFTGIFQIVADPELSIPLVGANGAISTLLGAYAMSFPRAKIDSILPLIILYIPIELPALFYLFWWFVQQLFYGMGTLNVTGGVNPAGLATWSHGLGLLIGAGLVPLMVKRKPSMAIY
jgi:membrane associated rhomboid family serine protease